ISDYASMWTGLFDAFVGLPVRGFTQGDTFGQSLGPRLQSLLSSASGVARAPFLDTVNLKQFRDVERLDRVCFQALIRSRMTVTNYHRGGLLGPEMILSGDPTGGFRVKL